LSNTMYLVIAFLFAGMEICFHFGAKLQNIGEHYVRAHNYSNNYQMAVSPSKVFATIR